MFLLPTGSVFSLGRSSQNVLQIDAQWVSRFHCKIEVGDTCTLTDLESKHGTTLNRRPVTRPQTVLASGDVIRLGTAKILVEIEDSGQDSGGSTGSTQ